MKYSEVSMLYNQGIINQITNLINSFFTPYTPDINFRFEINITLYYCRIIAPLHLI